MRLWTETRVLDNFPIERSTLGRDGEENKNDESAFQSLIYPRCLKLFLCEVETFVADDVIKMENLEDNCSWVDKHGSDAPG